MKAFNQSPTKKEKSSLNPAPTDIQLALFARHKRNKTSPGNPKWYRPLIIRPFVFKPNQPPKYPKPNRCAMERKTQPEKCKATRGR